MKKKNTKGHILYDFIYRKILNININKDNTDWWSSLETGRRDGRNCSRGREFYFQVMEMFWKSIDKKLCFHKFMNVLNVIELFTINHFFPSVFFRF